ncbi:arylamine N-acetyltransferase [Candidatus Poribacteria bacterium]|nr:arylamine N-acetyltransferase [Candidatus Poribacteria bacterium]
MRLDCYLERIGLAAGGAFPPTLESLSRLARAHQLHVPFENLDIHEGIPLRMDPEGWYAKIVERRRGGFCYELNGLFAWALECLGFEVTMFGAAVTTDRGRGHDLDHMLLRVNLPEGAFLADVGFDGLLVEPLPMCGGEAPGHAGTTWKLQPGVPPAGRVALLSRSPGEGEFRVRYDFAPVLRAIADFTPRCLFFQHDPSSGFRRHRLITRTTEDGRVTLMDHTFVVERKGTKDETRVRDPARFLELLGEHFQIEFSTR